MILHPALHTHAVRQPGGFAFVHADTCDQAGFVCTGLVTLVHQLCKTTHACSSIVSSGHAVCRSRWPALL